MTSHLVVIGGGQAAAQAIQTSRQLGFDGRITLVASEDSLPYQRPPLSKQYLAGNYPRDRLVLRPESFYQAREVDVLLRTRATAIDPAHRRIELDDGGTLDYTRLLVATGSRPRELAVPGIGLEGVHYLRSIADVDAMAPRMSAGRRLVVIGGGYIGLEVAAVAVALGLSVTVLEAADRVLGRVVAPLLSAHYAARHREAGVRIECGATVMRIDGRSTVTAVETSTGDRYEADLVIVGIGIVPNVELALAAGLDALNGIRVDAHAQTAAPDIAAAGDCTQQLHPFVGTQIRLESVHNAIGQGKAAAHTLAGTPSAFDEIPWFWSDQYDMKLQIAGIALDYDATVLRGEPDAGPFALFYLRNGVPIAVDCVSSPRDFMQGKKLIAAQRVVPAAALADVQTDLEELLG